MSPASYRPLELTEPGWAGLGWEPPDAATRGPGRGDRPGLLHGELSHAEIARQLALPAGTVKRRIRLGLQKLRDQIDDTGQAPVGPVGLTQTGADLAVLHMRTITDRFIRLENILHRELVNYSATFLRLAVGAVFLGFGFLKLFPGVSPAENLAIATTDKLTLGLVPGGVALVGIALLECFIGVCLLAGRWMRLAIWLLAMEFVGILAPLFLLPGRLFDGPHHAPTLEGQYVLKDVILVAAGMVIAATTFRGGRMVRDEESGLPTADAAGTYRREMPTAARAAPSRTRR